MVAVAATTEDVLIQRPNAFRRLMRRKGAVAGLCVVAFFVLIALLAPWLAPYDPIATNFLQVRKPPSAQHWMGTDEIGRDLMSLVRLGIDHQESQRTDRSQNQGGKSASGRHGPGE